MLGEVVGEDYFSQPLFGSGQPLTRTTCTLDGLATATMAAKHIDTLDLPQIYQKPSYSSLLHTLSLLELTPPIWSHSSTRSEIIETQESLASQRRGDIARYLGQIIKSPLEWLDDEQREEVWELASKRMSERCGRTAMGEVVRKWPFEDSKGVGMEIVIREPALTGDSLGFKTWGSSYVLSRHLPNLRQGFLSSFFHDHQTPNVLELGSGTGLLGLAAAALWGVPVTLSDLPNIVPNLRANAASNETLVAERGGRLSVGALTWGGEKDRDVFGEERFPVRLRDDSHCFIDFGCELEGREV